MKTRELRVTFEPSGRGVYVLPGTSMLEAAGRAGIVLQTPCGGKGTCGKCRVKVVRGNCPVPGDARGPLSADMLRDGYRLACQSHIDEALVIDVPAESTFESSHQILVHTGHADSNVNPPVRKVYFELKEPTSEDPRSDLTRLRDVIGQVTVPTDLLRRLPGFLRAHGWRGTAVMADSRLIALEAGNTSLALYGVAFDLGTTTVVGKLYHLTDGKECAIASRINPQVAYGDDVISRIMKIREHAANLGELQTVIMDGVNGLLQEMRGQAQIAEADIYEAVFAGNSTMQQIFCGMDTSALGELPFVPVFEEAQTLSAAILGLRINPVAEVHIFPQIGGFVGGDTVSGMVATRLDRWDKPVLFVDIGTNGEIVLSHNGRMMATSTAAGPAFEGARITQGMRAAAGAIEKVLIGDDVLINVIGNVAPVGLCGTALIDAAAELLRKGILDSTGRILEPKELPPGISAALRKRLVHKDGETHFVLAYAHETANREPILLWQRDVRELQLATGAIRAGIQLLLRRAGVEPEALGGVLLAGAFGNFIRRSNARRIGLLPQIPCERISFIGNAASLGATLVLLSAEERLYAKSLANRTEHVDLSLDAEFQMEFATAMLFPESDVDACKGDR